MKLINLSLLVLYLTFLGSSFALNLKGNQDTTIELKGVLTNITEYSDKQMIRLFFVNDADSMTLSLIQNIEISNKEEHHTIPLNCNKVLKDKAVCCTGDFQNVRGDKYKINKLKYNNIDIELKKDISFDVHKRVTFVALLDIKGEAYQEGNTKLTLIFDRNVKGNEFSNFNLRNNFNVTFNPQYKIEKEDKASLEINFNFEKIPEGKYYINFMYKKKPFYDNKKTINIIKRNI